MLRLGVELFQNYFSWNAIMVISVNLPHSEHSLITSKRINKPFEFEVSVSTQFRNVFFYYVFDISLRYPDLFLMVCYNSWFILFAINLIL